MVEERTYAEEYGEVKERMNRAKECMQQLRQKVPQDMSLGTMSAISRKCFEKLGSLFHDLLDEEREEVGDILSDMDVALIFMKYKRCLARDDGLVEYNRKCSDIMRRVIWNFTDASEKLREECGKSGMLSTLTLDLISHRESICGGIGKEVPEVISAALAILHNCAKAEDNLPYFMEADAVQAIRPYSKQHEFKLVKMVAVLTLSYIMKDADKQTVGRPMIEFILEYLKNAVSSSHHQHQGFSVEELVDGLSHLAKNKENKILIFESDVRVLDVLADLMKNGREEEKRVSVEAVWTLSFGETKLTRGDEISSHPKIIPLLKEIEKSTLPFKHSAAGALWTLHNTSGVIREVQADCAYSMDNTDGTVDTATALSHVDDSKKKHIMISYNHGSKEIGRKIYERLRLLKYRMWIDEKNMEVQMFDAMAKAVKNSAVFLMCMSQKYKNSKYCKSEALFAYECGVPIIPLRVEPEYTPDGWLRLIRAGNLYIDLSDQDKFESGFELLLRHIGERGKLSGDDLVITQERRETNPATLPIEKWSVQQVNDWAIALNLRAEMVQDLDGKSLAFLCRIKDKAQLIFYKYATGQLHSEDLRNLMNLYNAIDGLNI